MKNTFMRLAALFMLCFSLTANAQLFISTNVTGNTVSGTGGGFLGSQLITSPAYIYSIRVNQAANAAGLIALFDSPESIVSSNKVLGNVSVARTITAGTTTNLVSTQGASPFIAQGGGALGGFYAGSDRIISTAFTTNTTIAVNYMKIVNLQQTSNTVSTFTYDPPLLVRGLVLTNLNTTGSFSLDVTYSPATQ